MLTCVLKSPCSLETSQSSLPSSSFRPPPHFQQSVTGIAVHTFWFKRVPKLVFCNKIKRLLLVFGDLKTVAEISLYFSRSCQWPFYPWRRPISRIWRHPKTPYSVLLKSAHCRIRTWIDSQPQLQSTVSQSSLLQPELWHGSEAFRPLFQTNPASHLESECVSYGELKPSAPCHWNPLAMDFGLPEEYEIYGSSVLRCPTYTCLGLTFSGRRTKRSFVTFLLSRIPKWDKNFTSSLLNRLLMVGYRFPTRHNFLVFPVVKSRLALGSRIRCFWPKTCKIKCFHFRGTKVAP